MNSRAKVTIAKKALEYIMIKELEKMMRKRIFRLTMRFIENHSFGNSMLANFSSKNMKNASKKMTKEEKGKGL